MGIMGYINAKKASFQAKKEKNLAARAQEAEVRQYKAEIEIAQQEKIASAKQTENRAKELRNKNSVVGKYFNTVKTNNTKNVGRPSLFGTNNQGQGYKGPSYSAFGEYKGPTNTMTKQGKKKQSGGWDPAGDYKGPFGGN